MHDSSDFVLAVQIAEAGRLSEDEQAQLDAELIEAIAQRLPLHEQAPFRHGVREGERTFVSDIRWTGADRHPDPVVNNRIDALSRLRKARSASIAPSEQSKAAASVRPVRVFVSSDTIAEPDVAAILIRPPNNGLLTVVLPASSWEASDFEFARHLAQRVRQTPHPTPGKEIRYQYRRASMRAAPTQVDLAAARDRVAAQLATAPVAHLEGIGTGRELAFTIDMSQRR